jgi:glycine cleavage system H protein
MKIDEYDFPDDLYYHKEHLWAKVEDDLVLVGLTDFTQQMAGTIKRIATLEEDDEVSQDKPFGTMSSGKWTGKLYSPISGEIAEVNEDVIDEPKLCNEDPYDEGWIIKVTPSDLDIELGNLMKTGQPEFETWIKKEIVEKKALLDK